MALHWCIAIAIALMVEDMPKMQASSAHFAGKFDIDADVKVLDEIDTIVG